MSVFCFLINTTIVLIYVSYHFDLSYAPSLLYTSFHTFKITITTYVKRREATLKLTCLYFAEDAKLNVYWQNEYHHLDGPASQTNVFLAFANSFVRRATEIFEEDKQECDFLDLKLKETHVLFENNRLQR